MSAPARDERALHWYVGALVVAAAGAYLAVRVVEPAARPRLSALALVPLFALAEVFVVHFQARRSSHTFSLVEIPLVIGLLYVSPAALVIAHLAGGGFALAFHRTQRSLKLVFNMSSFVLVDTAAIVCFAVVATGGRSDQPRTWAALGAGCGVASLVGIALVSGAMWLAGDAPTRSERLQGTTFGLAATLVTTSTAVALTILAEHHHAAALLVVLPIVAIYIAHRSYVQARQERRHVDALHDAAELLAPDPTSDVALHELLRHARETFFVETAVLILDGRVAPEPTGLVVTDGDRTVAVVPDPTLWHDALGALLTSTGSRIFGGPGRRTDPAPVRSPIAVRNGMAVVLHPDSGSRGYLAVLNRLGDVGRFNTEDLRVLETMARQIATAVAGDTTDIVAGELRVLEAELRYRERHDGLTGLANQAGLFEHLMAALASGGDGAAASVLVVDVNMAPASIDCDIDEQHVDLVLAQRLRRCVRDRDGVARLDTGRFAVAAQTPGGHREAFALADRVRLAMGAAVHVDGISQSMIVHVGVSGVVPGCGADSMLAAAEMALDMARTSSIGIEIVELA